MCHVVIDDHMVNPPVLPAEGFFQFPGQFPAAVTQIAGKSHVENQIHVPPSRHHTEIVKADTYDAKVNRNVNVTGLDIVASVTASESVVASVTA